MRNILLTKIEKHDGDNKNIVELFPNLQAKWKY